jgi:tRNA G18 (ribose-2'-O)-methylase SpoU
MTDSTSSLVLEQKAWRIDPVMFGQLDSRRQHEYLACLARSALRGYRRPEFRDRYLSMQATGSIDRFLPPNWLSESELLEEIANFHELFSGHPVAGAEIDEEKTVQQLTWEPVYPVRIVLDQVRSPYNVGSIVRLIDNFGFEELIHGSEWLRLDHPQLKKAARGAEKWIPVRFESDLPGLLAAATCPVIGLENDADSIALDNWVPPKSCFIVVGNESYGISRAIRDCCRETIAIPLHGYKRSLNVHHALAIAAFTYTREIDNRTRHPDS